MNLKLPSSFFPDLLNPYEAAATDKPRLLRDKEKGEMGQIGKVKNVRRNLQRCL